MLEVVFCAIHEPENRIVSVGAIVVSVSVHSDCPDVSIYPSCLAN